MTEGISHITFIVKNLERTARIFVEALRGQEVYSSGDEMFSVSREKFFLVGGQWIAIMEGEALPERTYNHVAFKIRPGEVDEYRAALEKLEIEIRIPRSRVNGEGESIYFYDYDNHTFELHTGTLEERLKRYAHGVNPTD
ncbi:FosX/FosE/FosI family fosfomycin resistance hydrolase [Methylopila sp. M107]|uniref:FosX/FosE/FosI family fosfomycin resistance hydrolase n=1 Tax=Methylopila sp. M107 TaxID=1101190 RepID=UPI00047842C9|nr:FosX/FosE/FosI family fosfomycin resistance hydrolase [Methylopila sp. M107]